MFYFSIGLSFDKERKVFLTYSEFLQQLTERVKTRAGSGANVCISRIQKPNISAQDGIAILHPGENTAPVIGLDALWREYQNGVCMEKLAEKIYAFHQEHQKLSGYDSELFRDFERARTHIVCRLVNYERNHELLARIPHQHFLDLAVIYYYQMDDSELGRSGILVQNTHIRFWNITTNQLHAIAACNTRILLPWRIATINSMVAELPGLSAASPEENAPALYVLTNEEMHFGAVNLIFGDVLVALGERLESDFYVLPSSVHECMILPVCAWMDATPCSLRKIVVEINNEFVRPEDILGDSVYQFSRDSQTLQIAASA